MEKVTIPTIRKKTISNAYESGNLEIVNDEKTGDVVCKIKDKSFYFDTTSRIHMNVNDYLAVRNIDDIFDDIMSALKDFRNAAKEDPAITGEYVSVLNASGGNVKKTNEAMKKYPEENQTSEYTEEYLYYVEGLKAE